MKTYTAFYFLLLSFFTIFAEGLNSSYTDTTFCPPIIKNFSYPKYPAELLRKGVGGIAVLDIHINTSGSVDSVIIDKSLHPELDSLAITTAREALFDPATVGNEPVPVVLSKEIIFNPWDHFTLDTCNILQGTIYRKGNRSPLPDALIRLSVLPSCSTFLPVPESLYLEKIAQYNHLAIEEKGLIILADSAGYFIIKGVPGCSLKITAAGSGFIAKDSIVSILNNNTLNFYLLKANNDFEVIVFGKKSATISEKQLTKEQAVHVPGGGGDVVRALFSLPGISVPRQWNDDEIYIRGNAPFTSRIFLDGIPLPRIFHNSCGLPYLTKSIIPTDGIKSIQLHSGGFGSRYGNATGGIVEIEGQAGRNDMLHGNVELGILDGQLSIDGPISKNITFNASAKRSVMGDLLQYAEEKIYNDGIYAPVPYYWDGYTRIDFTTQKAGSFFLSGLMFHDGYQLVAPEVKGSYLEEIRLEADNTSSRSICTNGGWNFSNKDCLSALMRFGISQTDISDFYRGYQEDYYSYFHLKSLFLKAEVQNRINRRISLTGGLDIELGQNGYGYLIKSTLSYPVPEYKNDEDISEKMFSPYVSLQVNPTKNLTLKPEVRYDYLPETGYQSSLVPEIWKSGYFDRYQKTPGVPSLRFSSYYQFTEDYAFKCAVGNYSKFFTDDTSCLKSAQYLTGTEIKNPFIGFLDIQVYFTRAWQDAGSYETIRYYEADIRNYGLELFLTNQLGQLSYQIAYSLSKSEIYNDGIFTLADNNHTHQLDITSSWIFNPRFKTALRTRFASGYQYTPIVNAYYDADQLSYIALYGKKNSAHTASLFYMDFLTEKTFSFRNWELELRLELLNALGWLYKNSMYIERRPYYLYDINKRAEIFETFKAYTVPYFAIKAKF